MKVARVPSPSRPANGGQAYLWWICIRTLLLFAVALLPFVAVAVTLLMSLRGPARPAPEAASSEMSEATVSNEIPEATASKDTE